MKAVHLDQRRVPRLLFPFLFDATGLAGIEKERVSAMGLWDDWVHLSLSFRVSFLLKWVDGQGQQKSKESKEEIGRGKGRQWMAKNDNGSDRGGRKWKGMAIGARTENTQSAYTISHQTIRS